jgi:hypothetical protein
MNEAGVQFHIENNDYFGTLATVLDLVSQDLRKKGHHGNAEKLSRLRDDLLYLQNRYHIRTGEKESMAAPGGRVIKPHYTEKGALTPLPRSYLVPRPEHPRNQPRSCSEFARNARMWACPPKPAPFVGPVRASARRPCEREPEYRAFFCEQLFVLCFRCVVSIASDTSLQAAIVQRFPFGEPSTRTLPSRWRGREALQISASCGIRHY